MQSLDIVILKILYFNICILLECYINVTFSQPISLAINLENHWFNDSMAQHSWAFVQYTIDSVMLQHIGRVLVS